MKLSKWIIPATLVAILAVTNVFAITYADYEEGQSPERGERPNQEHMEEMRAAVESGDYNAFAEVAPKQLLEVINEGNFGRFQEMHQHMETAREIGEELGLPKMHQIENKMKVKMENLKGVKEAIENGNYDAWLEIVTESGKNLEMHENITEENFHLLQELHEAKQNQDFEKAQELAQQLGFPEKPEGNFKGIQKGGLKGQRF